MVWSPIANTGQHIAQHWKGNLLIFCDDDNDNYNYCPTLEIFYVASDQKHNLRKKVFLAAASDSDYFLYELSIVGF